MKKSILLYLALLLILTVSKAQTGITWTMGNNIATSASGNEHPRVVTDRSGNPLVIWHHTSRAMFSRWNGTAFTTPVMLNPMSVTIAGASWMGPDIAAHGDTVYVVYKQTPEVADTSHIFCLHSFDGGVTFSSPVQVDNIADSISRFPSVTVDASGNPIIAFMKFNAAFVESRWVVTKSTNFGMSFSTDVKASGWSSATSTICDCCPGSVVFSGNTVAMLYRDNNSNIRDTWASISTNTGSSFSGGMNVDEQNWMLMSCPATGPDGVIIGDSLYTVFTSGASGEDRTYFSRASISAMAGASGSLLTGTIAGLTEQNYPRISAAGTAVAIVWKQTVSGVDYLGLRFTNNIATGLPSIIDTVDMNSITNADVVLSDGKIWIVWEDDGSGTVKYLTGTYVSVTGITENNNKNMFSIYPNPASDRIIIDCLSAHSFIGSSLKIMNVLGETVYQSTITNIQSTVNISQFPKGIYFVQQKTNDKIYNQKIIKQ
jgi:hypothetical protein